MLNRWERGQFVIILAFAILGLLGCAALATDLGYFEYSRLKLQNIADAAALAGELEIIAGRPGAVDSAALNLARLNGFDDQRGASLHSHNPPLSGAHAGDPSALEIDVQQVEPVFLLKALGLHSFQIAAKAVAAQRASPVCVLALNRSAAAAIQFSGSAPFRSECAIISDSTAPDALSFDRDLRLSAPAIGAGGRGALPQSPGLSRVIGDVLPAPDPFAVRRTPRYAGCDHLDFQIPAAGEVLLSAGVFCNGITAPPDSTATVFFRPGAYIIRGGGLTLIGRIKLRTLSDGGDGSGGAVFYLTGDSSYPYRGVNLVADAVLRAPRTGDFEGILFLQDRSLPDSIARRSPSTIIGAPRSGFQGALYFPTTTLTFGGGRSAYTILIADQIRFALLSPTTITSDYSSLAHGAPVKTAMLTE